MSWTGSASGRSGVWRQTDRSAVGNLPQFRPPLSRRGHGRLSTTPGGSASRRRHATTSPAALRDRRRGQHRRHSAGTRRSRHRRRTPDLATRRRPAPTGRPGQGTGHRPVRDPARSTDADRLRREGRHDRRPTRHRAAHDRRPGLFATALFPGVSRRSDRTIGSKGSRPLAAISADFPCRSSATTPRRWSIRTTPRPAPSSGIRASRRSARTGGSRLGPAALDEPGPRGRSSEGSATSSTTPWPGGRSPASRPCGGTWPGGSSRSPIDGFTEPPASNR